MLQLGQDALRRHRADFFDIQGIGRLENRQTGSVGSAVAAGDVDRPRVTSQVRRQRPRGSSSRRPPVALDRIPNRLRQRVRHRDPTDLHTRDHHAHLLA